MLRLKAGALHPRIVHRVSTLVLLNSHVSQAFTIGVEVILKAIAM